MAKSKQPSPPSDGTSIDLSGLASFNDRQDEGIDVEIVGLDDKPLGLTIRVAGTEGTAALRAHRALHARRRKAGDLRSAEDDDDYSLMHLALLTKGWSPNPRIGGEVMEFSPENAERLYRKAPVVYAQVQAAAGKRDLFTKG